MSDLKAMYRQIVADGFPDTMTITLGETELKYRKRVWNVGGELKGLRYGENPDQPRCMNWWREKATLPGKAGADLDRALFRP